MRRGRLILPVVLIVLFLAGVGARLLQPDATEVAKAVCVEKGWPADDLTVTGFRQTGNFFLGERRTVTVVAGPGLARQARVTLHRPAFFLGWRAVDWEERK